MNCEPYRFFCLYFCCGSLEKRKRNWIVCDRTTKDEVCDNLHQLSTFFKFWFYPYADVLALYIHFPSFVKKTQAYYSGEIWTHDLCNSKAVSYQLEHRESTKYTVLTHIGVRVKPKLIFFINNASFTSNKLLRYPLPKHRIQTASSSQAISVV